jgi:folate/biopterin transporter
MKSLREKLASIDINYLVIILVALSQGITGLSDLAISYLYKDDLHLVPAQVSRINSIATIPWIVKPIYGFISDSFPILGYRRKPYLFIFGITVTICWILMSFWVDSLTKALFIVLLNQTASAFCNVIGEALVVETSQKQKDTDPDAGAKNVSMYFMIKSIGSLITAFSSGALLEYMDKRKVFLITACFPIMIVISAILLQETKIKKNQEPQQDSGIIIESSYNTIPSDRRMRNSQELSETSLSNQISLFWSFLKMDQIYKPVIFIFFFMITPSYGDPLFFFYTEVLKFAPMVMGRLRLIYGVATVLGIIIYNNYLKNVGFKKIIWATTILSMLFNMLSIVLVSRYNLKLGIPDFWFCMTADALTTALAEINTLPLLVLACNICPKNIEGTLYAFLMSVINFGSLIANQLGAALTSSLGITNNKFDNLSWLIFIANIVLILPMPSLYLIDESAYIAKPEEKFENGASPSTTNTTNTTYTTNSTSSPRLSTLNATFDSGADSDYETKKLLINNNKKQCGIDINLINIPTNDLEEHKRDDKSSN